MASCLWMYLCFLGVIFTFVATEEMNENITCTFTNGQDCSHLLNLNNTSKYVIEKDAINRTGVKIIFDTERRVELLTISSGEELAHRVQVVNITRGSLTHLVNLSCSEEIQIDEIKLEPVVVSKELQIDFVKGCGVDTDPIIISSIHSTFEIDEEGLSLNVSKGTPSSEKMLRSEETLTSGAAEVSDKPGRVTWVPTLTDQKQQQTEPEKQADPGLEKSTVQSTSVVSTKGKKAVPTTYPVTMSIAASARPTRVNDKNEIGKKNKKDKKINFKFEASKSSAWKLSSDLATLFLVLAVFYKA